MDDAKDQVEDALKQLDNMNIPNLQKPLDALDALKQFDNMNIPNLQKPLDALRDLGF